MISFFTSSDPGMCRYKAVISIALTILGTSLTGAVAAENRAENVSSPEPSSIPGSKFRECSQCPDMTVIDAGHFTMSRKSANDGRTDEDPEGMRKTKPAREVTIEKIFALGTYPVTRREFSVFVLETGRGVENGCHIQMGGVWILDKNNDWRNPGFAQTANDPVTCVSWEDAQGYVQWLNAKRRGTPGYYRLPSWEEIEYAAGAGTTTLYYWGNSPNRDSANYGSDTCLPCRPQRSGGDRWLYTSPVGSFPPNAFGLYDMAGNVWQWAQRCRPDPNASPPKTCRSQVLHGGSWLTNPENLRTGVYSTADARHRNYEIGFRVARSLDEENQ